MPTVIPYIILYFFVFMFGACVGSFYNVIALRLPLKESFTKGRSHCPKCMHTLSALDLVPFFSYIFLRGKCRYCKEKISFRYPVVELIGGLSAVFSFYKLGLSLEALLVFYVISILVCLSIIDLDTHEIPNGFHIALLLAVVASFFLRPDIPWQHRLIGFFVVSVPMLIIAELVGGFGGGDVKLMAVAGALLGYKATLCSFLIGLIISLFYCIYALAFKKSGMKTEIAFGPYLAMGIIISYFYSDTLISFYLGIFF